MKKQTSFLSEWEKIKDANICAFEEFEILFGSNPNGRCFRKYTSYPWSKENFFFGTYEDFSHFQKTTNEIPSYLFDKVGSKVFNLTILSFFRDENNKICANCKCDCGNQVIKTYDAISKGNARSCGCNKGRKPKEVKSVYDLHPDIIDTYWDFEKNTISPKEISIDSEEEYWWKGYAHSYKVPIHYFLRSATSTSFPEQTFRFFLQKNNLEVISRHFVIYENKKYELDLFLPQLNIGIEYDGAFWHVEKSKNDILKNKAMEGSGIVFIRVREKGLSKTGIKNGLEIIMQDSVSNKSLSDAINKLFEYIELITTKKLEYVTPNDISKNKSLIQSQYSLAFVHENVANSWLDKFWSKENAIEPYFVSLKSTERYYFKCPHGLSFYCSPNYLTSKAKTMNSNPSLNCVFDHAFLCQRTSRVLNGLRVSILNVDFSSNCYVDIDFSIENKNDTAFNPLSIGQYSILQNGNFYSFEGKHGYIEVIDSLCIEKPSDMICPAFYKFNSNGNSFELLSFSQMTYRLRIKFEGISNIEERKQVVVALNLSDQVNFVYKVCLYVECFNNNITSANKVYTWDAYRHITKNPILKLDYVLNESEAEALLAEF